MQLPSEGIYKGAFWERNRIGEAVTNVIIELYKYLMIILMAVYTYLCFWAFRNQSERARKSIWRKQIVFLFLIHAMAYTIIYLKTENAEVLIFYGAQLILFGAVFALYYALYPKASRLLVNNMCMLLMISFFILTRLSYDKALRQFKNILVGIPFVLFIPVLIQKCRFARKLTYFYAFSGIVLLGLVAVIGKTSNGARISLSLAGITVQPSEFVKIIYVFFIASAFAKSTEFLTVVKVSLCAAVHVVILVISKDLGGALIFFVTYLVMLYVASKRPFYLFAGLLSGSLAAAAAYRLFAHVRIRVLAWSDPFSVIDKEGYQITQSLFAIGTGGWFGMGLYQGSPNKIPIVEEDFIFAAISEEIGGLFALCLLLLCVSCFIMFMNISMQMKDEFYRLTALGLSIVYGFQVFLTIGGVIKLIPSTGVTLPLVSYGGSSALSTLMMFAVIQGLYLLYSFEGAKPAKQGEKKYVA